MKKQFLTRTFFNVYESLDKFVEDLETLGTPATIALTDEQRSQLYITIASKYGDSNIRYTNERLFKMNLFLQINSKWHKVIAWQRDQARLQTADLAEFQKSGKIVMGAGAHNTSASYPVGSYEGIPQMDQQSIQGMEAGELETLKLRIGSYRDGEEERFLRGLKPLFMQILAPQRDLLYGTTREDEETRNDD